MKHDFPGISQLIASIAMLCATIGAIWLIHTGAFDKRVEAPWERLMDCLDNSTDRFKIVACQDAYSKAIEFKGISQLGKIQVKE